MSAGDFTASGLPHSSLPGRQLAAARESRGMTVAEIAQQLKLSPWQVDALEAGDYERLPGAVFVRGFIRNYARLVKLDAADLLATDEQQQPLAAPVHAPALPPVNIPFPTGRRSMWHKYAAAAVVISAVFAAYEFYPDDSSSDAAKSTQVELPAPDNVVSAAPAPAVIVVASIDAKLPAKQASIERAARPSDASAVATAEPHANAGEQVLHLRFSRESWVEIRDRNGRKILSRLNAPGSEQVVSGLPPLSLVVGNANGVELTHNEQPVNLAPHTKVDVARLTLE
jgi:cytoskeleton protein RodZ